IHVTDSGNDPLYGYRPAVNAIVNRLKNSLSNQCLPQKLNAEGDGSVPCLILVQLPNSVGPGACKNPGSACDPKQGLLGPGDLPAGGPSAPLSSDILAKFCDSEEATYRASNGAPGGPNDPDLFPVCALQQLTTANNAGDFDPNGSCAASNDPGWC